MEEQIAVIAVGADEFLAIIVAMSVVLWALIKVLLLKEMKRISSLELDVEKLKRNVVPRPEFNATIKIIREEIRLGNDATNQGLREVHSRLDALLLKIAKVTEG